MVRDAEYGGGHADLLRLLPHADIVVLACTQSAETKGLVGKAFLAACKRGVRIVNVARGGLLDYCAVRDALASGHIGGLGLDVAWQAGLRPPSDQLPFTQMCMPSRGCERTACGAPCHVPQKRWRPACPGSRCVGGWLVFPC